MHLRALVAFILLSLGLALLPLRPALAALAEELSEVTRLHHAGQSQAALERANRFLAGKPKDAPMRFLKSVVLADSGQRAEPQVCWERPDLPDSPSRTQLAAISRCR